jgi:large subunit ribosomal protein L6
MSRRRAAAGAAAALHRALVPVPPGVTVSRAGATLTMAGPLGTAVTDLAALDGRGDGALRLDPGGGAIEVASASKAFFGTLQSLLRSKLAGVSSGHAVTLKITGVGYRAALAAGGDALTLKLGHSHDCRYALPPAVRAIVPDPTTVTLVGLDKNQVTQVAANVRALRPPGAYTGKGVRREGEVVRLKPGKRK